jgi:dipeptidyl aminopeptidase/acylaminoacyl peptidase
MTLQSGLTRPKGEIKAMLLQYPMTTHLTRDPTQKTMGAGPLPKKTLDDYIAAMTPGKVVSSSIPATDLTRLGLSLSLNSYNRFNEFFGTGKHLWPITAVEDANFLPPMTIFHGGQDTVVPLEHTELFIDKMKGLDQLKGTEIRLAVIDGEEHGFDTAIKEDEQAWLKVELEWVEGKWLA